MSNVPHQKATHIIGAVTLAILPLGNKLLPTGKQLFQCVTDFPRVKLPRGNFYGYFG